MYLRFCCRSSEGRNNTSSLTNKCQDKEGGRPFYPHSLLPQRIRPRRCLIVSAETRQEGGGGGINFNWSSAQK